MNLLALLIGLIVERLATRLFHLRRLRWLDRLIDAGFRQVAQFGNWPSLIPVIIFAVLLAAPVLLVQLALGDAFLGFPYLIVSIVVLFFSLGPKDIGEDVTEYCRALESGDENEINVSAKSLIERNAPTDPLERIRLVEEAVCVQANNRLFAVMFWFILLGPLGAWAYRVTDLIRRRAAFNAARGESDTSSPLTMAAAQQLQGWLAWIPARLTAIGFAMAGSFDGAMGAWRDLNTSDAEGADERHESLLARVGVGALALHDIAGESTSERGIRGATAAKGLVFRSFIIWAAVIGVMTLYGYTV